MASIRKKALHGSNKNQIKSPTIKRSPSSSVILQGWLFKQGSDGLMLWKKRWFVLADYCLFYYKGPAEEKLLGSCLLASYKISPCTSEDKIYRKFSFKAEHANMRTYYFSAESQASMIQWINALSLASICQENRNDNIESGKIESWVVSEHQPLYVNTPPKPKLMVDPSAISSARGCCETYNGDSSNYLQYSSRGNAPLDNNAPVGMTAYPQRPYSQVPCRTNHLLAMYEHNPFVYPAPPTWNKLNEKQRNPAPLQPNVLNNYDNRSGASAQPERTECLQPKKFPPRPHSADFLEHDFNLVQNEASRANYISKLQRPKSSLDVIRYNDYSYDSLHWSEEAYAEKMRQTCLYVTPHYRGRDKSNLPYASSPREQLLHNNQVSPVNLDKGYYSQEHTGTRYDFIDGETNKFNRSASARFPLQSGGDIFNGSREEGVLLMKKSADDKEKANTSEEREESMRRLLVWKQRMLQSPLTRKTSSGSARQSLISSKAECNNFQRKILNKDDNLMENANFGAGNSNNHNFETFSEKLCHKKKSHSKEHSKFQYHSLSSDEDDLSRLCDRDGRKHSHKALHNKKSALKCNSNNLVHSSNTEPSEITCRSSRSSNCNYLLGVGSVPGPSRTETLITVQPNVFSEPLNEQISSPKCSAESDEKTVILPSLRSESSIDNSCNAECQGIINCKPSDSGYSTLQDSAILKTNRGNEINVNRNSSAYSFDSTNGSDTQEIKKGWGLKLDESRVKKEFSYHYINTKSDDASLSMWIVDEPDSPSVLSEGLSGVNSSQIKENDTAHQSKINEASKNLYSLKIDDTQGKSLDKNDVDEYTPSIPGDPSSDFHSNYKIGENVKENESSDVNLKHFDSFYSNSNSSDIDKKSISSCSNDFQKETVLTDITCVNTLSSDEDRDDEVAAVLGKKQKTVYDSQCLKKSDTSGNLNSETENIGGDVFNPTGNLFPVSSAECLDEKSKEEHYMPMTPKKKMIASPEHESAYVSRNPSVSSFYAAESSEHLLEENSYVEMSHNSTSSSNNGIRGFKPTCKGSVTPGSSDLQLFEDNPDYEYISKDNMSEPVYVELSSSFRERKGDNLNSSFKRSEDMRLNKAEKDHLYYSSLKHCLPDVLNTSSPQCNHNSTKSDSSDADDEASKDLDCISTPTHPRFSLSDTFRPASYYLGANLSAGSFIGINLEQDSSDSDLVSPPPIPLSTPPVDDLGLSLDLVKSCTLSCKDEKESFISDAPCNYWKTLAGCEREHKSKKLGARYLPNRPIDDVSSETDSVESYRKEQLLKRRPVSADILDNLSDTNLISSSPSSRRKSVGSDIESLSFSNSQQGCVNDDNLSEDLPVSDRFLESLLKSHPDNVGNILNANSSLEKQSSIDSRFKINNVIWEYEKKNNHDPHATENINKECRKHKIPCASLNRNGIDGQSVPLHNQSGAPYYYSDILKAGGSNQSDPSFDMATGSSHSTSSPPLNNNKMRKIRAVAVNSSDGSNRDNHSKQNSLKHFSERKKSLDSIDRPNTNLNATNLTTKDLKGSSAKIISRSLTPDFQSKKHNSSLNEKSCKYAKNASVRGDAFDNSLRRARSFDGLLDESEQMAEKPRVLRASPSDAIFKLLQTTQTQSKNQECVDKIFLQDPSSRRSEHDHKAPIELIDAGQLNSKDNRHVRLVASLDNLKWQCENTKMRKLSKDKSDNFNSTPLLKNINDLNKHDGVDPFNTCDASYRKFDDKALLSSNRLTDSVKSHSSNDGDVPDRIRITSNHRSIISGSFTSYENKLETSHQWESVSSSPCDSTIRSVENRRLSTSHVPSSVSGSGTASCIISSQNGTNLTSSGENWNLELSAGELLGRTHEELVLLLIQLRRRSSGLCKAIDDFQNEISSKVRAIEEDPSKPFESSDKNEELKRQLMDLERQYEKGKPLVNLVDNMVKLGSLYHTNINACASTSVPQRREFNQKVQEQRLIAEEKKEWERLPPDQKQLQEKVKQLYKLDQILMKESTTLQNLQQDKAILEQALTGLRQKLDTIHGNPVETEQCRHQQRMLEKGLTRVRSVLAHNSKKLEETVAENARLEQELVILRQKLQLSRKSVEPGSTTMALECELKRVQDMVANLQRQRQHLCLQVRQLTEKSNSLSQQIEPLTFETSGTSNVSPKRRTPSSWVETDLDSQITQDMGVENQYNQQNSTTPPLVLLDSNKKTCIIHKEKPQEIKTVRIVKRESERRQRDRERNGTLGIPLINIVSKRETIAEESPGSSTSIEISNCQNLSDNFATSSEDTWSVSHISANPPPLTPRTDSVNVVKNFVNKHKQLKEEILLSKVPMAESCQVQSYQGSEDSAPVYLSKAAQEIVQEVAWRKKGEKRLIPKEKRRYHTVSGQSLFQEFSNISAVGSRDDLDMERALRSRVHTPDVVRSTLTRDAKFTAETIDTILGTPSKIVIPERYKPESEPLVSKEELLQRSRKAEAIRKMLTQSSTITPETTDGNGDLSFNSPQYKHKMAEEKQQREHLLHLNQILAQQVTEKSKIVAGARTSVPPT